MSPTATFNADFSKWNEGLRNAQAGLKPLEVSAKGVQAQLKAMATSLSGANIQKQAQLAVAAVNSIGGATKLTEAEQKRLNATVTEAIAKYSALGQKAPADMVALAKATKQNESALAGIGGQLTGLTGLFAGAFTVGAITSAAGEAIKFAGSLNDLSAKTGISVEALQEFKFAGSAVGVTLDDVTGAVLQMQKHLVGGDASVTSALKTIGVSFEQLKALKPEDQFTLIAEKLRQIEDPALRNKLAFDLMGKTAANVLPLIASGLDEARKRAEALGLVLDQDTVNQLDNLGDTWDALKVAGEALIAKVLVPFAPALTEAANAALQLAGPLGDLSKLHLGLAHTILQAQIQLNALDIAFFESINFGGKYDKQIAELVDKGVSLIVSSHKIAEEIAGVGSAAAKSAPHLAHFGKGVKDAGDDADKAREQFNAVVDDVLKVSSAIDKMFEKDREQAAKEAADALKHFTDVVNDLSGQTGLEKATEDLDAFDAAMRQGGVTAAATKRVYAELEEAIANVESGAAKLPGTTEENAKTLAHMRDVAGTLGGELSRLEGHLGNIIKRNVQLAAMNPFGPALKDTAKATDETKDWEKDLSELSAALSQLSTIAGGTFGTIVRDLAEVVGAANTGLKAFDSISTGIGAIHNASGVKDLAKGFAGLTTGILGAVTAAISFGEALVKIFKKDRAKEEIASISKEFGELISKDFAQQIEDQAKASFGGNRQATKIFDLDQIISQGGGITSKNLGTLTDRLHDVYSMIETGAFTADQAQSVLDKNFQSFVDFLGGKVTPQLKEIIRLNDEFGTHSKAIAQFVDAQANTALDSLSKVVSQRQAALDALNNAKTPDDRKKAQAQLDALPLTKGAGDAFGGALFGIFERLQKDGVSAIDTLKQIEPVIESLDKQFAQAGISGGAAFDQIKSLAGIATDEIAGPSFEAIQNYGSALEALNNAGILTQDQFTGLTDQITATYNAAVDALTKEGKDGSQALGLVQPQLQEIWELQQDFGYAVDDSTQKLLDQAVAAGEVGEKHRSVQEQTLDVMKHLDAVLSGIGEKFGVDIPNDVDKTTAAFGDAQSAAARLFNSIPDHVDVGVNFTSDQPPGEADYHDSSRPYSSGGVVYAARGLFVPRGSDTVPAMLTPGEFVMSRPAVNRIGASVLGNLNRGVGVAGAAEPTTVILQVDGRELARAIATPLPGEVRRLGVRVRT